MIQSPMNITRPQPVEVPKTHKLVGQKRKAVKQEPVDYEDNIGDKYGGMVGERTDMDNSNFEEGQLVTTHSHLKHFLQ